MKAVVMNKYGGPEVLVTTDAPVPVAQDGEVLVKVGAAGVNPVDWKIRGGGMRLLARIKFPYIPGSDLAGEVIEVGAHVKKLKPGDRIFATVGTRGGAYAEYAAVRAEDAALVPKNVSDIEAASLPIAGLTAWAALTVKIKIKDGERLLINGAAGGVGTLAVQMAKAYGAHVTGVCGTGSADMVRALGADEIIDYHREDVFRTRRYDHIFDTVGNLSFLSSLRILNNGGVLAATLPNPASIIASPIGIIFGRRRYKLILVSPNRPGLEAVARLIETGKIKPVIDKVFPLDEVRKAHVYGSEGHAHGKIVLSVG